MPQPQALAYQGISQIDDAIYAIEISQTQTKLAVKAYLLAMPG